MAHVPTGLITHSQKVCRLYKKVLRTIENHAMERANHRLQQSIIRDMFDKNKNIKDARVAKKLILEAEEECFQYSPETPFFFPDSVGGIAHKQYVILPDYLLDKWDPVEKAMYPKYFAKREEMKKEYKELYYKMYPEHLKPDEKV
ncbi:NADH dehydrogenase (ubiquinone) B22 subunit [Lasioglossum baleicum]|uniref:NADH dehydrogenase (ubiquinone) B22 subunit n=1 Tax=Lasioglossum baleicum TaxID=434251 RepID=UPI003FCEB090